MQVVWFPTWSCQNYGDNNYGPNCPYCNHRLRYADVPKDQLKKEFSDLADINDVMGFYEANKTYLKNTELIGGELLKHPQVELSGGEPFMHPQILDIIENINHWDWAITSNTLLQKIRKIKSFGNCVSWSASWHPFSNKREEFKSNIKFLLSHNVPTKINIVGSKETLPILKREVIFAKSLVKTVVVIRECNSYFDKDLSKQMEKVFSSPLLRDIVYESRGRRGAVCDLHSSLLVIGPDGYLYPCGAWMERKERAIGKANSSLKLSSLKPKVERCKFLCVSDADIRKHIRAQQINVPARTHKYEI